MSGTWTLVALVACQEYDLVGEVPPVGVTNPVGLDNPTNEDRIVQVTTPAVDILWIVDDSSSMGDNQRALVENFPSFMEYFLGSGLDYHIGVVSTDMYHPTDMGQLREYEGRRWIDPDTEDAFEAFDAMGRVGVDGSSFERGRDAAYTALELLKDGPNAGFLRDDETAGLHLTVITDEPDFSREDVISKEEFAGWLNGLRPEDELVTFNSICNPPADGPADALLHPPGTDYIDVTQHVGGILKDISSDDWVTVLEQLGMQAAGLKREYFLSRLPVESTIEVTVETPEHAIVTFEDGAWSYSGARNSITFEQFVPEPLSVVHITYTVLASVVNDDAFVE